MRSALERLLAAAARGWPWAAGPARVQVRPVHPDDAAAIGEFFSSLSPHARQRRFHAGVRGLSPSLLERFTHPDWYNEVALIAVVVEQGREICIGEARYAMSDGPADSREFALAVADDWQRRGIGRRLLRRLIRHAEDNRVARIYGDVIRDNLPMLSLAGTLGFRLSRHPGDASLVRVVRSFPASSAGWPGAWTARQDLAAAATTD